MYTKQKNFAVPLKAISYKLKADGGFAAIVSLLAIMSMSVIFASGFLFVTLRGIEGMRDQVNSAQGYYASEAGIEDAIYRIKNGKNIGAQTILSVGTASTTTNIATNGNVKTIIAAGVKSNAIRTTEAVLTLDASESDFFYGVQVGEGGLTMGNNARVNGSVYSNGNVSGSNGARITGDAWVAGGASPTLDAKWETQNADFSFGNTAGSVVTTIDSSGSVGQYTSLAMASDGFARISYMDNTNKDLKYARCTDADCTASVKTAVDTAGEVYEVTSLALNGSDTGYMSYYHDGNDDLKFARCTNADCSAKTLTTVESSGNVGDASAITIGSDGFARIAYFQDDNGDVKFARCTNADCTTKVVNMVDATGYSGEHLSLALGSNGFARISYFDDTSDELRIARCLDADCATKNITVVDTTGNVGKFNSLALDNNNFAHISYYDDTNDDLKFAQCTNEDCSAKNITAIDSSGTVGLYTSLALGSDGFARISYYDSSNSALKFVRCTNAGCTTKNIVTVDNTATVGTYTSLALGSDGFARISYFDDSNDDLKFVRCIDADCTPPQARLDVAQSFQLVSASAVAVRRVSLYIKKVGFPGDITIRIMRDDGGHPGDGGGDVLAIGTLAASAVTTNYGWVDVSFATNPTLNPNTTYWIMADTSQDNANYWVWGQDTTGGYAQGSAKFSDDWNNENWSNITGDLDFRVWVGGSDTSIDGMIVDGNVHAHSIGTSNICGDAYYQGIDASSLNFLNAPTTPTCSAPLTNGAAYPGSTDPPAVAMPISQGNIDQWKIDAAAGGTCVQPVCDASGNLILTNGATLTIGPKKITGNLTLDNNAILTLTGTLWVQGTVTLSNNCSVRLDSSYGDLSGILLTDGVVTVSNNCAFAGSGDPDSHIMLLTDKNDPSNTVMNIDNGAVGVIYYAANGRLHFSNNAAAKEATGYGITMDNGATITYESGLANTQFSSGPSAGWAISGWKEVE